MKHTLYILFGLIILMSCGKVNSKKEYLPMAYCSDKYCNTIIYEIEIARHNIDVRASEESDRESTLGYCLEISAPCGGTLYYKLEELVKSDSAKYLDLANKYRLHSNDEFFQFMTEGTYENSIKKLEDMREHLFSICDCK